MLHYLYMPRRPERIYQVRFDEHLQFIPPQEVTPPGSVGLEFRPRDEQLRPRARDAGRLVREVREAVYIRAPIDAAHHLLSQVYAPFEDFSQEEMWVLLLNTKYRITHEVMVYRGTVNAVGIRMAELFREATKVNAPALIMSHVHPSGDPNPSPEDVAITKHVRAAAELLDIDLLDHIVVGKDAWVSLKERALGFDPLD
jgi:DNA repair protein RadC